MTDEEWTLLADIARAKGFRVEEDAAHLRLFNDVPLHPAARLFKAHTFYNELAFVKTLNEEGHG